MKIKWFTGGISKFLSDKEKEELVKKLELKDNDILFFGADNKMVVYQTLGALRW